MAGGQAELRLGQIVGDLPQIPAPVLLGPAQRFGWRLAEQQVPERRWVTGAAERAPPVFHLREHQRQHVDLEVQPAIRPRSTQLGDPFRGEVATGQRTSAWVEPGPRPGRPAFPGYQDDPGLLAAGGVAQPSVRPWVERAAPAAGQRGEHVHRGQAGAQQGHRAAGGDVGDRRGQWIRPGGVAVPDRDHRVVGHQ